MKHIKILIYNFEYLKLKTQQKYQTIIILKNIIHLHIVHFLLLQILNMNMMQD